MTENCGYEKENEPVKKRGQKGKEKAEIPEDQTEIDGQEEIVLKKRGRKSKFEERMDLDAKKEEESGEEVEEKVVVMKRGRKGGKDLKFKGKNGGVEVKEEGERVFGIKRGSKKGNDVKNEDLVIENGQENGGVLKKRTRGANKNVNSVVEEDEKVYAKNPGARGRKKAKEDGELSEEDEGAVMKKVKVVETGSEEEIKVDKATDGGECEPRYSLRNPKGYIPVEKEKKVYKNNVVIRSFIYLCYLL